MDSCRHHLCGGVDWNRVCLSRPATYNVTTFAVVWIEIVDSRMRPTAPQGHHLCGGVDWNLLFWARLPFEKVTTFAVVWIEILQQVFPHFLIAVTTFAVVWIEITPNSLSSCCRSGHHLCGGVDWNDICAVANKKNCHHLCGDVDWNKLNVCRFIGAASHHLAVVRVEIPFKSCFVYPRLCHSLYSSTIRNDRPPSDTRLSFSATTKAARIDYPWYI